MYAARRLDAASLALKVDCGCSSFTINLEAMGFAE